MKKMHMLLIFLILIINSVKLSLKGDFLNNFIIKDFLLTNSDFFKIYYFNPRISDLNHEIIIQINSSLNGNAKLCTGYFQNKSEINIHYDFKLNEFINCQKSYNIIMEQNYEEYNITYDDDEFNMTNYNSNGYYCIILYIDKNIGQEFSGTITAFVTNKMITITSEVLSKYFIFKNNYSSKNYTFRLLQNKYIKKYLHVQIQTLNNNHNPFNISIINDNNYNKEEKENITSYNNFYDISDEENYYIIYLCFSEEIKLNTDFAIFFEYTSINNNLMELSDEVNEFNFLTKSDYYFYQTINSNNYSDTFYYIANDFSFKRGMISLSFLEMSIDLDILNDNNKIPLHPSNLSNFSNCKSRHNWNSFAFFRCTKNNLKNNTNILILKVSSIGINPLKIRKVHFKKFEEYIIDTNLNKSFHKTFNSEILINKMGYFYIPKLAKESKYQLIYCSKQNTMNIYYGDFDITESKTEFDSYDKIRLFKISHNSKDNFSGYTIITNNREENYFIQVIDISKDIYDNLLIERITEKTHLNKEITLDIPIKNVYIFNLNEYDEKYSESDIIFDVQALYGKLDVKYIDIDSIPENNFDLNKIILFNKGEYQIADGAHPFLVKKTTEFIKITNINYHLDYYFKAKFYLNKYYTKEDKEWNELNPIYLNPLDSKIYSLENIYGNVNYMIRLGDIYNDYTTDKEENLATVIIGNFNNKNILNLSNKNNIIVENETYINFGDTIHFINKFNKSILLWTNFKMTLSEKNIISLYLSKNFYYLYTFSHVHKLCFDWFNIKKKINDGLVPQKIVISLLNEMQTQTNGYYYQVLNIEEDNSDYLYFFSPINSIYYHLEQGESHVFLSEDINITIFDYYYKGNSYINYMVFPSSGLSTILFYIEYSYDISNSINKLKFLEFDDSIYSLNLNLNNSYLRSKTNKFKYIIFQCLSCSLAQSTISLKYNNRTYSQDDDNDNVKLKQVSFGNTIGYINMNFLDENIYLNNLYINILKPYQIYIKYYYSDNINENYKYQNSYNINIEKGQNLNFIVSFDYFLKNVKTNYTILILNKTKIKNEITNECLFFYYLEKRNNFHININYFSFVDNNENIRIKKEIKFEQFGNYGIYILAQSLDSLSIYKFLGMETYTYTNDTNDLYQDTNHENFVYKSKEMIAILIFIILLLILIILFIVFRYVRKRKLIKLFNSINNSLISDNNNSSSSLSNNLLSCNNLYDLNDSESVLEHNYLFEKPKMEKENENKEKDKELELDPGLLGQSPAPLFGNTYRSEEDKINDELSKINESSNNNNNIDEEKSYTNTNNGYN